MVEIKIWYEKIIDAVTELEMNDYKPTDLYIFNSISNELGKEYSKLAQKGVISFTHFMGMRLHHVSKASEFKVVDINYKKNYLKASVKL